MILNGSERPQDFLSSSSDTPIPYLEFSTRPTKIYRSSKNCTHFDTLPSDIFHNIYMWNFSLLHHEKFNIFLAQITQHNPFLCSNRSYKLKYVPSTEPMSYKGVRCAWACRRLPPDILLFDRLWGFYEIKHDPIKNHMIHCSSSTSHL